MSFHNYWSCQRYSLNWMRSGVFYTWAILMVLIDKNLQCASVYSRGWFFVKYTVMNMMVMSLLVSLVTGCETSNQNYSHSGRVVDITKTSSGQTTVNRGTGPVTTMGNNGIYEGGVRLLYTKQLLFTIQHRHQRLFLLQLRRLITVALP